MQRGAQHKDFSKFEKSVLQIAKNQYPDLNERKYLNRLDRFAQDIQTRLAPHASKHQTVLALNNYLFSEQGFTGNTEDYYDPRNSFLNDVLDRKLGIPILLAIIYMEVGRRLGLAVSGISFPGHFLVKVSIDNEDLIIDPYNHGKELDQDELNARLKTLFGKDAPTIEEEPVLLRSATDTEILVRVLRNLKNIYIKQGDVEKALVVFDQILALEPDSTMELRERGKIYEELEYSTQAIKDYERYLELEPDADDADEIETAIFFLQDKHVSLH
jgi:regulator of sirC expression with transglutaminase-like and TPR domain